MRALISLVLVIVMLTGCGRKSSCVSEMMQLRQHISKGERITFEANVTADYGDRIYTFSLMCVADPGGSVDFSIESPDTIAGITGSVSEGVGKLTFDDTVLLFEPLTQGQLTPAIGPWLMFNAVLGGYVRSASKGKDGTEVTIDDVFKSESFQTVLTLNQEQLPICCEIIWNNRRILSIEINNFTVM